MCDVTNLVRRYGSPEDTGEVKNFAAGPLSLDIDAGKLRNIQWHGVELIRAIDTPIRDRNWATVSVTVLEENAEQRDNDWSYERNFTSIDGQLAGKLSASGNASGELSVEVSFTASSDFETNRTGFNLLHPIDGLAGADVEVTHADGRSEMTVFPELIAPSQPVFDIVGLSYSINGAKAKIAFEGDVFEMEDQRNWSDASYKTYCRPVSWPRPYLIKKNITIVQKITVLFSGDVAHASSKSDPLANLFTQPDRSAEKELMPEVSLVLETDFLPDTDSISFTKNLEIARLSARIKNDTDCGEILSVIKALNAPLDLEIIVPNESGTGEYLEKISQLVGAQKMHPDHVIAIPEEYMDSYKPDGDWPDGLTPDDCIWLCRNAFPGAKIGGGVLTNFTEFNRCRPQLAECDFITHATSAIVHAADDKSVFQTLEAQTEIYASVRNIAPNIDYRMGLVSIGFRTNPYGPAPLDNPQQNRLEMAQADPRQRGLFAASWMVGAMAATQGFNIDCISLAAAVGPLGVIYRREDWPQPFFDEEPDRIVYPAYHVIKALARIGGQPRQSVNIPKGLFGVASQSDRQIRAIISNGTPNTHNFAMTLKCNVLLLNDDSFDAATCDPDWLDSSDRNHTNLIELDPYAVAFVGFA